jgi:tryptophan-rich sensory protein
LTWRSTLPGLHCSSAPAGLAPALAEIVCLDIVNVLLIRQTWRADRTAAVILLPYVGWTAFATALNAEIVRLNPSA